MYRRSAIIRQLLKAGYSKNMLSVIHVLLHHALEYAVYPAELIKSNPASYIKVPPKAPTNIIQRHIITPEQLSTLLEKYPFGTAYYIPILILFHTGVRIGELLGLSWEDIDFDTKTITLRRQIAYISRRGSFFTTLKTKTSSRYIVINEFLTKELERWEAQQQENELTFGDAYIKVYFNAENKIICQSKIFTRTIPAKCKKTQRLFLQKLCRQNLNADTLKTKNLTLR